MSSTGQIVGGGVGAIAGFFLLSGNVFLGAQIGMAIGGALDPPKGPTTTGPRLDDLTVQTSSYGQTIPRVYGTVKVTGNVLWLENNHIKEKLTKKKSGGKGGKSKTTTKAYTYSATFAVALCKGPIVGIRRNRSPPAITVGLLPILWGTGSGSEVMSRIAAPMVGGMLSSTVLTLAVIPAIYALVKQRSLKRGSEP